MLEAGYLLARYNSVLLNIIGLMWYMQILTCSQLVQNHHPFGALSNR